MNSYFQYLQQYPKYFAFCGIIVILGVIVVSLGKNLGPREYVRNATFVFLLWALPSSLSVSYSQYRVYKNNYTTCDKPAAKQAGYIFYEGWCWKPIQGYVKVGGEIRTQDSLLTGKLNPAPLMEVK